MLHVRRAAEAPAEVCEGQFATGEQGTNDAKQRGCACRVSDDQSLGEPL